MLVIRGTTTLQGIALNARSPTEKNLRHLQHFIAAYAAAVLAAAATMALMLTASALVEASFQELSRLPSHLATMFIISVIGAAIFAFPAMIVGYPIAVWMGRRFPEKQAAIACALIAPIAGTAAQLGFFTLISGLHPAWLSTAIWFLPCMVTAGAAVGWTTARLDRRI